MPIDYSKFLDGNALLAIRDYIQTYSQPLNANLTSISSLPTNVTGLIKMTNGVASIDSSAYKTDYRYRPIKVGGTTKLANTSSTALDFVNPESGYNVVFEWDSTNNGVKATVDLSGYQPLDADLTAIAALSGTSGFLKKTAANTWTLDATTYAPLASPTFTGTVTLPTTVKIGTSTSTGLVKYTNGVLSIDTNSYITSHLYRPVVVGVTTVLSNTSSKALKFINPNPGYGYNVAFEWDTTNEAIKANVDLSGYQPLNANLTSIAAISNPSGYLQWVNGAAVTRSILAADIPNLDASKITSGTFADARIASASTWNAKYTKPSGGIPASDLAESYILSSTKGAANGVASLGSDGKVPTSQLPSSVTGGMQYKGTFDATSGSTISGLDQGWYYVCSTAGNKNPDGTAFSDGYEIGDWAVYNGSSAGWAKIDNSDKVSSVNGKTGAVTLTYSDVGAASSGHTHTLSIATTSDTPSIFLSSGTTYKLTAGGNELVFQTPLDNNFYPSRNYTYGLQISASIGTPSSCALYVPYATVSQAGVVSTEAQNFKGFKTFYDGIGINASNSSGTITYEGPRIYATENGVLTFLTNVIDRKTGIILSHPDSSVNSTISVKFLSDGSIIGNSYGLNSYLQLPSNKGTSSAYATLATLDDIPTISTYTYQEALDILESTD